MKDVALPWIRTRGARALSASIVFFSAWAGWSGGATATAAPIKVACVGGFSTHSDKFSNNREAQPPGMQEYPAILQKLLGPGYFVRNFGDCCASVIQGYKPAETHPYVNGPLAGGGPAFPDSLTFLPDIVVIGSWGRHDWGVKKAPSEVFTIPKFQTDFDDLVTRYQALSSHPVIFVSLPIPIPYGEPMPAAPYIPTSSVVPAIEAVASKYHLPIVDMYQPFLNHKELFLPAGAGGEGEHLQNPGGFQAMADAVFKAMQQYMDGGVPPDDGGGVSTPADDSGVPDAGAGVAESGADDAAATGSGSSSGGSGGTGLDAATGPDDATVPPTSSGGSSSSSSGGGGSNDTGSSSGSCSVIAVRGGVYGGASAALALGVIGLVARRRSRARAPRVSHR